MHNRFVSLKLLDNLLEIRDELTTTISETRERFGKTCGTRKSWIIAKL